MSFRKPREDITLFKNRRTLALRQLNDGALILTSGFEKPRNSTVEYPFRVDSNFYYLTGFEEPESVLFLRPGKRPESVLFVRPKNLERETWDGFRFGPEAAAEEFGVDLAYPIEDLEVRLPELLKGAEKIYSQLFQIEDFDRRLKRVFQTLKSLSGRSGLGNPLLADASEFLGEFRLFKSEPELTNLRKACQISAEAHCAAMRATKPGVNERYIQGLLQFEFLKRGAAREGYNSIVAGGSAATTLHYIFNDQPLNAGDLLLIDAGAEFNYFTGDITRTFPVNGKFSLAQKKFYEAVLEVQLRVIAMIKPGVEFKKIRDDSTFWLVEKMVELGLLTGNPKDLVTGDKHKAFYPHGIGHWLGMDVHDSGIYVDRKNAHRKIEAGMTFTVEPGLYIPINASNVPHQYLGMGVRIEDDVLVTSGGCEVLTSGVPKTISEIEEVIS